MNQNINLSNLKKDNDSNKNSNKKKKNKRQIERQMKDEMLHFVEDQYATFQIEEIRVDIENKKINITKIDNISVDDFLNSDLIDNNIPLIKTISFNKIDKKNDIFNNDTIYEITEINDYEDINDNENNQSDSIDIHDIYENNNIDYVNKDINKKIFEENIKDNNDNKDNKDNNKKLFEENIKDKDNKDNKDINEIVKYIIDDNEDMTCITNLKNKKKGKKDKLLDNNKNKTEDGLVISNYHLIRSPLKMAGEGILNEEINLKYTNKNKVTTENINTVKKIKENFKKLVLKDNNNKPNISEIILNKDINDDIKLKILKKVIKYTMEDEVFSDDVDKIKQEINNLIKIKKLTISNDYDILLEKIENKEMPIELKNKLNDMYYRLISNEDKKLHNYIYNILRLPYNKIPNILDNISNNSKEDQKKFIESIYKKLNDNLYGLSEVKDSIISYICQKINNPTTKSSKYLCLCGAAGVGKTSIVHAISEALNMPYSYISLANIDETSLLIGHNYTFEGSQNGAISEAICKNSCTNGILLFDEIDKCKDKIQNTMLGIFDPLQNNKFKDSYFGTFYIDLSECMMILCLNDIEKINPILRDRLHIINIPGYSNKDKKVIINKYILPKLSEQYKLEIEIEELVIDKIIIINENHKGIRQLIMYITKIYELIILDNYTNKYNFNNKFCYKDISYLKLNIENSTHLSFYN